MKAIETQKPYIAMLLVQLIYAGMALFSKAAISSGMSSFVFVTYRQAFATLALAPFALFIQRLSLSLNLYGVAINYTTATFAAAATNAIPAITFTLAVLLRTERVSIRKVHGVAKVVGSALGVSGALVFALVKGPALVNNLQSSSANRDGGDGIKECCSKGEWVKGSLIMILANVLWSLWIIFQGRMVKQYPAKVRFTALQCVFGCIMAAVVAVVAERDASAWKLGWNIHLYAVAYCGVVVTGLTYWLQLWAIQRKGPVFAAMFTPLALIVAAIFSAIVWKEVLYLGNLGGAVLLVGGLYLVLWGKNKEEKQQTKFNGKISNGEEAQTAGDENAEDSKDETATAHECNTPCQLKHDGVEVAIHNSSPSQQQGHIAVTLPPLN
ncbi:unnamed protein product [Linum tenue]|uniref:WAT1-related protein n=1 Tax=Linum tenue TaxID=586396 RepID=A0AAV0IH61_9ROSI|nr:unnamed protein product [Linum tenue]